MPVRAVGQGLETQGRADVETGVRWGLETEFLFLENSSVFFRTLN